MHVITHLQMEGAQFGERSNQCLVLGSQKYHFGGKTCHHSLKLRFNLFSDKSMPDCGDNLLVATGLLNSNGLLCLCISPSLDGYH